MNVPRFLIATTIVTLVVVGTAMPAAQAAARIALVVSSDAASGQQRLRYAERDATRMARVLRDLGGFSTVIELRNPTPDDLRRGFERAESQASKQPGSEILFYYSGHADSLGLSLGDARFLYQELRGRLERSRATVRVALLDACHAGAATRPKGGHPGPAFSLETFQPQDLRGAAIVAASAAGELAQESSLIEGSYFTHHLLSALRGAADQDRNGAITLGEAYRYTYARTIAATVPSVWGPQHPSYEYNLAGTGDLVLTRVAAHAGLVLPSGNANITYYVQSPAGDLMVEIVPPAQERVRVAMPAGRYRVVALDEGKAFAGEVLVRDGDERALTRAELHEISLEVALGKGGPARNDDVMVELALAGLGPGIFASSTEVGLVWLRHGSRWSYGLHANYGRADNVIVDTSYQLDRVRLTADIYRRFAFGPLDLLLGAGVGGVFIHEWLRQNATRLTSHDSALAPTTALWLTLEALPRPRLPVHLTWGGAFDLLDVDGRRRLQSELRAAVAVGARF